MTELFLSILKTSLSGGVIILLILLLRLVFRKTPKALICLCWMVAILRLLVPIHIETNWSLQPSTAVLAEQMNTFLVEADEMTLESVNFQPTVQGSPTQPEYEVTLLPVLSVVYLIGCVLMLSYALISYLCIRKRVGEAVKISDNVFCCPGLDTAFLFGYFRPRIYLPPMEDQYLRFVHLHERSHQRRGDHWLMLAGYIALCLHWFNPLVWLGYICLCRDIERACDERVIRGLDTAQRKEYANALLVCGKHRSFPVACPVAFGEISIKQRILGVLNYRRPALWVCILLLVLMVGVGVFFLTDPVVYPPYYMEMMECLTKPLDEVCHTLGIAKEDLLDIGTGNYVTPIHVKYAGVTFQLHISTNISIEGQPLGSFSYSAVFDGSTDEADKATANVAHRLYKTYGPGVNADLSSKPDLYKDISVEEITAAFNAKPNTTTIGRIFDYWDITDSGHGNLDAYLKSILTAPNYEKYYKDGARPCYMVRFLAGYDRERNTKSIYITYQNYMAFANWETGGEKTYATKLNPSK